LETWQTVPEVSQAQDDSKYASYLKAHHLSHLTISGYFAATGNTAAWTPLAGGVVFISPTLLNTSSPKVNQGTLLHEMLHEVYGIDYTDVMKTLQTYDPSAGINPKGPSEQITTWMIRNCVSGKGNQ